MELQSPNMLLRKVLNQIETVGVILLQEDKKATEQAQAEDSSAKPITQGFDDIANLGLWINSGGNADLLGLWIERNKQILHNHKLGEFIELLEKWRTKWNVCSWNHKEGRTVLNAISDALIVRKIDALSQGKFVLNANEVQGGQGNLALQDIQTSFKFLDPEPTLVEKAKILYNSLTPLNLFLFYLVIILIVGLIGVIITR